MDFLSLIPIPSAAHFSIYGYRTPLSIALFDRGVEPFTGTAIWLEAHHQNEAVYAPSRDATSLARFGQLSVAATQQLLVPLLIVVLGAAALAAGSGALGPVGGIGRAAGIAGAYLMYVGIFVGITLGVSSVARGARPALLLLLTIWVFNALVAARVATLAADALHPLPTWHVFQTAIEADKRLGIDGHNPVGERADELKRRLLEEYGVSTIEELPVDFSGVALQEDEEYGAMVYDRHYGELRRIYAAHDRIQQLAAVAAPALAVRDVSMGLAGSDLAHHLHFVDAAETYRRDLVRMLNEEIIYNAQGPYDRISQTDRQSKRPLTRESRIRRGILEGPAWRDRKRHGGEVESLTGRPGGRRLDGRMRRPNA